MSADTDGDGLNDDVDPIPLTVNAADGDCNANGSVNTGDLLWMTRITLGLLAATNTHLAHCDLHPVGAPDGAIGLADIIKLRGLLFP